MGYKWRSCKINSCKGVCRLKQLEVKLGERSYPIYFSDSFTGLTDYVVKNRISGKVVLVTDDNVDVLYSKKCMDALTLSGAKVSKYVIKSGEEHKNLDTVREIYDYLLSLKLDRGSAIAALGGGVVGDIAGFAAATYLRGIKFIQIPTSLLAQSDSSVGGKVGVDFKGTKNIIGAFYQPVFVYMNLSTLKTLSKREFSTGLAEIIKHGIIRDRGFFKYLEKYMDRIKNYNMQDLVYMAEMNCKIKGSIVQADEKEGGLRAILNFGHTIGHAVETVSDFKMTHGEAISIGMAGEFSLAVKLDMVEACHMERVVKLLKKAGLPVKCTGYDKMHIKNQMLLDKKVKNNRLAFVLPTGIGNAEIVRVDNMALIDEVLNEITGA